MNNNNNNILFLMEETENNNKLCDETDIQQMMDEYLSINNYEDEKELYEVFTIKELQKICEYYEIKIKKNKDKKDDIISMLVLFESLPENYEVVQQRQKMWCFVNEILNDPKMKKHIIWN
jgi:hypothetical protein